MKTVPAAKLVNLVAAIMQGGGSNADEARTIARRLVDPNLVGPPSCGPLRRGDGVPDRARVGVDEDLVAKRGHAAPEVSSG